MCSIFKKRSPTPRIAKELLALEREVFKSGYQKAFLLFMDSCSLCKDPKRVRPTPKAMGVDVFSTMLNKPSTG